MRLIEADALKAYLQNLAHDEWNKGVITSWAQAYEECAGIVDDMSTIEPERKKGKWVGAIEYCKHLEEKTGERYQPSGLAGMIYCNQCWHASDRRSNYCRECGAKMEEGDRE